MSASRIPNTYLIGAQKAGTTTLHDWLIQHPEIFGLRELKDVDFFADPELSLQSRQLLAKAFKNHANEPFILQSFVNYMLYPKALTGIFNAAPDARLIVILRNPVARAFSAYHYFKKLKVEKRDLGEALLYNPKSNLEFSRFNNDFTYIEHGLYYEQLSQCLKIFPREQILILDFEDIKNEPQSILNNVFDFLGVTAGFVPILTAKNVTGSIRSSWIHNLVTDSNFVKKYLMKFAGKLGFSPYKRKLIKQKLIDINTSKRSEVREESSDVAKGLITAKLRELFIPDVEKLDELLNTNFRAKWFGT